MFGSIGITELIVIGGVALMVLGPDKFPEFAKMAARLFRDIRGYADEVKREISKEIKPIQKEIEDLSKIDPEKYIDSLVGEDEEDEEDDGTYNVEPDPDMAELYGVDEMGGETVISTEEEAGSSEEEPSIPKSADANPYDTYPHEEDGYELEEKKPETLDG